MSSLLNKASLSDASNMRDTRYIKMLLNLVRSWMANFYFESKLSPNIDVTQEGFLICRDVAITRSGDFIYSADEVAVAPDGNGMVRMWRSIEEVANPDTIASFEGKPLTLLHPDDAEVNPDNYSEVTVGTVQNVRRGTGKDMDKLIADLLVMEKNAIQAVMSREMREVSVGFTADQIQVSPGMGVQAGIRGNHVAIVPRGRAGNGFAIRDSSIKGEVVMSLKDKILKGFGKALDEALPQEDSKSETNDKSDAISSLNERISGLEAAVNKMLSAIPEQIQNATQAQSAASKKSEDQVSKVKTYDSESLSRAEILAPGVAQNSEDLELSALTVSYSTNDGKAVIDSMLGGKEFRAISTDSALKHTIFIAASEVIKAKRDYDINTVFSDSASAASQATQTKPKYTPEEINEINKKAYNKGVR